MGRSLAPKLRTGSRATKMSTESLAKRSLPRMHERIWLEISISSILRRVAKAEIKHTSWVTQKKEQGRARLSEGHHDITCCSSSDLN